jgi:hypothetical protein
MSKELQSNQLIRLGAVVYLSIQTALAVAWWVMLFLVPSTRRYFIPSWAPDVALMAFFLPDALLFIGAAAVAAFGLFTQRRWGWTALCIHGGAAVYAALYGLAAWVLTREAMLTALVMSPCLVVQPWLIWTLRPRVADSKPCE